VWHEAKGSNVTDVDGNRYLDLTAGFGVAAIGHRHPQVTAAVRRQTGRLLHGLGDVHSHVDRAELARRILAVAPVERGQVFFGVSGSDAVEIALKTALLATGRRRILAFEPAYHGLSLGTLPLTSRPAFREPFVAGLRFDVERLPFATPTSQIEDRLRGLGEVACVVVEPIAGREGILLPPEGWLTDLSAICRQRGVLLVADEIFTGCGRTGRWFAVDHEAVQPDILCCGKALGGGLPIAAVVARRDLMAVWDRPGEALHTGTFVANPLSCAAALATLDVLRTARLPRRARRLGLQVASQLHDWPQRFAAVTATRGRGLAWGIELTDSGAAHRLTTTLLRSGVLALAGGPDGRVLQLMPPLVISERQLATALKIVETSLGAM
jgi:4-aminobutyrate aminotransferase-like enzyme